MKPSVHDSLATATKAYSVLQWLSNVVLSHWEGRNVCSYWWKSQTRGGLKEKGGVAGHREDNDGFLGNLKRKRRHMIYSEANDLFRK